MTEILAVEFEFSIDDHVDYFMHFRRMNQTLKRYRIWYGIVVPSAGVAIGAAGLYLMGTRYPYNLILFAYFSFFVSYSIYFWLLDAPISRRRFRRMLSEGKNRSLQGPTRIELRPDSVSAQTQLAEGLTRWKGVEDVQRTDQALYITISVGNSYVIPRRAFANAADFDAFGNRAMELWRSTQPA